MKIARSISLALAWGWLVLPCPAMAADMTCTSGLRGQDATGVVARVAFLSDLHLDGEKPLAYQNRLVRENVTRIMGLSPRPTHVVVLGDLSVAGKPSDYAVAKDVLSPFVKAGMDVAVAMGNHDRRGAFMEAFPECAQGPVPGRVVRVVDVGVVELVILDSHDDGKVDGAVDESQRSWLARHLLDVRKPVFICVHHDGRQMKRFAAETVTSSRCVAGYIHGHRHEWIVDALHGWSGATGPRFVRSVGLPSAGYWGDVGFVVMDCLSDSACLTLHETDCFFPNPSARNAASRRMREENDGARIVFPYDVTHTNALPHVKQD